MIHCKRPHHKIYSFLVLVLFFSLTVSSCKKEPKIGGPYTVQSEVRDSAYLKIKDIYLWTDLLPSIQEFRPRDSKDIYEVMTKVRSYQPLDRFSFVETKEETERASQGLIADFGFLVKFYSALNDLRVNYVYNGSPADDIGVKRGWKVLKINGRALDGNRAEDNQFISDIFTGSASSAEFSFQKPDGAVVTTQLSKANYPLKTVLYSNVFSAGSRKVGYFVYNQFSGPSSIEELLVTLRDFQAQSVNDVIVDLRYNRGGFVSTQDTLANMLAPSKVGRGQNLMYTYQFNQKYSKSNVKTLWYKTPEINLNLTRIVFIVTPATASASELLINNLKPVMNVKLVGEETTFGKPVGFFPIPVFQYNIYPVSFKTVNSAGSTDYFKGFPVDKKTVDDLTRDFGDVNESSLKEALNYLATGSFTAVTQRKLLTTAGITEEDLTKANSEINRYVPKLEIENRFDKMPAGIRDLQIK